MVYNLNLLELFAARYEKVSNMRYILMNVLLNVFGVSVFRMAVLQIRRGNRDNTRVIFLIFP